MGFNLTKPFGGAMQSLPFEDPFGVGVTFHVRPLFYGPFQRAAKAEGRELNLMRRAIARASKLFAIQEGPAVPPPPANGADGAAQEAPAQEPPVRRTMQELIAQCWREIVEETPDADFSAVLRGEAEDAFPPATVALLVESVDGLVNDRNEPATVEEIPELLADESIVSPGLPYAGMEAGFALRLWLVAKAREAAKALSAAAADAGKASAPSSAGGSKSSRSSKRRSGKRPSAN
jgi:hypothetical protein